jgi:PKD repeat protein
VDCSGFVSRAWGLTTKYSTTTLENISTAYSSPTLVLPGDIFDYSGSHTRLVDTNYTNGNYKVMESSANGWDVSYNTYTTAQLTSYSPRFYIKVQNATITAAFTSSVTSGCSGMTVNYTDMTTTTGTVTSRSWSFPGGSPLTSSLANPSVTYATSGTYNVKEVVTSTTGKDSITHINYINVVSASPLSLPLAETFQSSVFPPAGWSLNKQNPDDSVWELCTTTGSASSQCMYFPANCGNTINIAGERMQLFTPNYSFSGAYNPKMWFDVAYEPSSLPTYSDTLVIYSSIDCGNTWTSIYSKGGATLCTTGSTTSAKTDVNSSGCFVPPSAAAWRTDSINLTALSGKAAVMFSFESRSGWGNIIYLDNINIQHAITTSVESSGVNSSLKVYPNPFRQSFTVDYSLTKDEPVAIYLTDVLGRRVLVHTADNEVAGQHSVVIDWGNRNTAKGLYILQLQTGSGNTFMKLISE